MNQIVAIFFIYLMILTPVSFGQDETIPDTNPLDTQQTGQQAVQPENIQNTFENNPTPENFNKLPNPTAADLAKVPNPTLENLNQAGLCIGKNVSGMDPMKIDRGDWIQTRQYLSIEKSIIIYLINNLTAMPHPSPSRKIPT